MSINFFSVFPTAQFDGNGVFWTPSSTIQTTISIKSTLSSSPGSKCFSVPGPPFANELVGAAEQVDSTFANTVVPPLVGACQIFDPDRSTSKGACKVRSDH